MSKEDVLMDDSVGLANKRRVMKALAWIVKGEFETSKEMEGTPDSLAMA